MTLRPRALVHRGHVAASGVLFGSGWLDEATRRARIVMHARDGATVLALGDKLLVRFMSPRRLDADHCEGTPLTARGGSLVAIPMTAGEHARLDLDHSPPALVHARGGVVHVESLANAAVVDLATWLDVAEWTVVPARSLGAPPVVARAVIVDGADGDAPSARVILGDKIPKPSPQREALLAALGGERSEPVGDGLLGVIGRWLSGLFASEPQQALPPSRSSTRSGTPSGDVAVPTGPGWMARMFTRLVLGSPLARIIGRRQAEYLGKTLRMFERGELDEALRHAIPLGSMPGAAEYKPTSLSVPTPRMELRLSGARVSASSSLKVGDDLLEHMRTIYRNAAHQLELAGRYEEAAFVLFELLGNDDAGVAMLERNGKLELAARMAESRGLAPGIVIRLWFLAGKPIDAVRVAVRTGAFADAITRLERGHAELAMRLRILWGERLASSGDYAAAFDAVSSVAHAEGLAHRWLDLAITFGGPTGARLLAKKVELGGARLDPDALRDVVRDMVDDRSDEGRQLRGILGHHWPRPAADGPARDVGRTLLRHLMLDAYDSGNATTAVALRDRLGDALLSVDGVTMALSPGSRLDPRSRVFEGRERGLQSIHDAVALPRGRFLLALGEAGIVLVDRDGRRLRHYEHPATRLLVSDNGSRVITCIRRGNPEEAPAALGRIDLVSGRAEPWCHARFLGHADTHDGAQWFLTEHDAVAAVDVQASGLSVLWRVSKLVGKAMAVARTSKLMSFVTVDHDARVAEVWTYAHGVEMRLDRRQPIELPKGTFVTRATVHANGAVILELAANEGGPAQRLLAWQPGGRIVEARLRLLDPEANDLAAPRSPHTRATEIEEIVVMQSNALVIRRGPAGCAVERIELDTLSRHDPWLELHEATRASVRITEDRMIVFDDLGRLVTLDREGRIVGWLLVS